MIYTAYRGEHGEVSDLSTRLGTLTFCNDFSVCEHYARYPNNCIDSRAIAPRVIVADVDIRTPFIHQLDDPFIDCALLELVLGTSEATRIACKFEEWVTNTNNWVEDIQTEYPGYTVAQFISTHPDNLARLYFNSWPYFDCPDEIVRLQALGYDGAIVASTAQGHGAVEYRPFSLTQVNPYYVIKL